ncbi:glutathione S-transferase family protein [Caulobacter sp. KR2-114]|uniref:glutathione S-transferase family protein n=1 Tax=Caulobacter sp. KR2-114 TaxID=3400912 RepID=UPI003BFDCCEB
MGELVLTTYDWVPEMPRGYVRDLRIRWALEEAALPYRVATTPFRERGPEHVAHQPFAQVPWLTDGAVSLFESGAILLHLAGRTDALLPAGESARAEALSWLFAALNSVEMASLPWWLLGMAEETAHGPAKARFDQFFTSRLQRLEPVVAAREWLAGPFSAADILMADVLRLPERAGALKDHPACQAYLARATGRPAFAKALADQLAHFAAAD